MSWKCNFCNRKTKSTLFFYSQCCRKQGTTLQQTPQKGLKGWGERTGPEQVHQHFTPSSERKCTHGKHYSSKTDTSGSPAYIQRQNACTIRSCGCGETDEGSSGGQTGQSCTKRVLISCKDGGHTSNSCRERATSAENELHCLSDREIPSVEGDGGNCVCVCVCNRTIHRQWKKGRTSLTEETPPMSCKYDQLAV